MVGKEESIRDWRKKIETQMAGWKKLRYVYFFCCICILILLLFFRPEGYLDIYTFILILVVAWLCVIVRFWNGVGEKQIILKIIEKLEETEKK